MCSGGPTLNSNQDLSRKSDVLTFSCTLFLFSLVLMLCDCMFRRGLSLCRSVLRTVCCYGLFPRGLCVHSSPKNRGSLWQHRCRLTCDMLERFLLSANVWLPRLISFFPSLPLFLSFPLPLISYSNFSAPSWSDFSFLLHSLHSYSLHHLYLCLAHDCSSKNSTDTW